MAGLAALIGSEIFRAKALLGLFDKGGGFGVAVVVFAQVAFGRDGDGPPMWVECEDIVERNREEWEVDGHDGGCVLWLRNVAVTGDSIVRYACPARYLDIEEVLQVSVVRTNVDYKLQVPVNWLSMAARYDFALARMRRGLNI